MSSRQSCVCLRRDQADILVVIREHGPLPPSEVARHLNVPTEWARTRLRTLERGKLVAANYSARRSYYGTNARAFEITELGDASVGAHDWGSEDDDE